MVGSETLTCAFGLASGISNVSQTSVTSDFSCWGSESAFWLETEMESAFGMGASLIWCVSAESWIWSDGCVLKLRGNATESVCSFGQNESASGEIELLVSAYVETWSGSSSVCLLHVSLGSSTWTCGKRAWILSWSDAALQGNVTVSACQMHHFASASESESALCLHADASLTFDLALEIETERETCVHCVLGSVTPFF